MPDSPELISVVLHLRPAEAPREDAPRWWGRAAHALLLQVVAAADGDLARRLHEPSELPRPFTVSTLMGPKASRGLEAEATYRLRFTAFQPEVAALLAAAVAPSGLLAPGNTVELDHIPFRILPPPEAPTPWEAATTYTDLASPWLTARKMPPRRWRLQFASPTAFHSGGLTVPFPLPRLVFGSLLHRWNAYAPVALPAEETLRFATEAVAVTRYRLQTRSVPLKNGGLRIGAVGEAVYRAIPFDRYWMSMMQVLASFALFSGVGAGATMGLGQARLLEDSAPSTNAPEPVEE